MVPKPEVLFKFDTQRQADRWHVFSDAYFGGRSQASWRLLPNEGAAEFSGRCSTELDDDADLARAGYCAATSKVTAIGDYFDLEAYTHIVYTVKGDSHTYMANIRVDSFAGGGGDIWQAPFTTSRAEGWVDVRIPLGAFLMTHKGRLVERRMEMPRDRVISVGVSFSALAAPDAGEEARSGVRRRPAAGAAGGGEARRVQEVQQQAQEPPGEGQQQEQQQQQEQEQQQQAQPDSGGGGEDEEGGGSDASDGGGGGGGGTRGGDFSLLLREIQVDGRAGVAGGPEE